VNELAIGGVPALPDEEPYVELWSTEFCVGVSMVGCPLPAY